MQTSLLSYNYYEELNQNFVSINNKIPKKLEKMHVHKLFLFCVKLASKTREVTLFDKWLQNEMLSFDQ